MRFIIYGTGAIGGVIGGYLAHTKHDVIFMGRPGQVNAINKTGLHLVTPSGTHIAHARAVTGPEQLKFGGDDMVFLTVKGQNTEEALQDLKKVNENVPVFCFQNGVRNEETAAKYFSKVYGVMVRIGAVYLQDGEVIAPRDPPGWLIIGRYPNGKDKLAESVATALREASFLTKTSDDVMPYKWGKLMSNLSNAIEAITNTRGSDANHLVQAAQKELSDALSQAGIKWMTQEQMDKEWPETTAPLRGSLDTAKQSSTWQSLARGQGSVETDFLNGEVVRLAKRLGRQAPVNEMLVRISKEMADKHEHPGKYTPAQLLTKV